MDDVRVGCQISNQANPFALTYNFWHVRINSLVRIIPWTIDCRITTVAFRYKTAEPRYNYPRNYTTQPFSSCEQRGAIEPFPVGHCIYMFVWITEQTAIISLYNITWLVFITETESVYSAVRTGCLNSIQINFDFCMVNVLEWCDGLGMWHVWVRRRVVYRVLVGKPEGKRPLGRPRRRWVDNIRMELQKVGCGYMDWIGLTRDRDRWRTLVSAVMNLRVPWNAGNFLTSCKPVSFSRRTLHHGVSK